VVAVNFTEWRRKNQRVVTIKSFKHCPELQQILGIKLPVIKPKPNTCYDNALRVCRVFPECRYVLGRVVGDGVTVDHAWNEWNGAHFDVTREVFAPETIQIFKWEAFVTLDAKTVLELSQDSLAPTIYDIVGRI
jgi:hypothetical protein